MYYFFCKYMTTPQTNQINCLGVLVWKACKYFDLGLAKKGP